MKRNTQYAKKISVCILSTILLFLMSSCIGKYEFIHKTDSWDDVKIEIVEIDGEIVEIYGWEDDTYYTTTPYKKIIVIDEIENKLEFLNELQLLKSYEPLGTPIYSIGGKAICITYPDSKIELITYYGSALITEDYIRVYTKTFDEEQFNSFLAKWSA